MILVILSDSRTHPVGRWYPGGAGGRWYPGGVGRAGYTRLVPGIPTLPWVHHPPTRQRLHGRRVTGSCSEEKEVFWAQTPSLDLGNLPRRDNPAQTSHRSSGSYRRSQSGVKDSSGRRSDSDRSSLPLINLEVDSRRGSLRTVRHPVLRARVENYSLSATFATLRDNPAPTH